MAGRSNRNWFQSGGTPIGQSITPNQDCFFAPFDTAVLIDAANTTSIMGTANHIRAFQFNLNRQITFTRATISVSTTSSGNHEYIGLYDKNKNLICQFTYVLGAGTGPLTATIATAITLNPGTYWLVRGADQTTSVLQASSPMSSNLVGIYNSGSIVRYGDCSNVIAGGNLPSSLGTVTTSATAPPAVLLEP